MVNKAERWMKCAALVILLLVQTGASTAPQVTPSSELAGGPQASTVPSPLFQDDFEGANKWTTTDENNGCDPATWGSQAVSTAQAHSGTHSAEFHYRIPPFRTSRCGTISNQHRYFELDFSSGLSRPFDGLEGYWQGWIRQNAPESAGSRSVTGKEWRIRGPQDGPFHEVVITSEYQDPNIAIYLQTVNDQTSESLCPGVTIRFDTWNKLKLYLRLNSPSKENGLIKLWLNGRLVCNLSGKNLRGSANSRYQFWWIGVDTQRDGDLDVDWRRYWDDMKMDDHDITTD